jgi:hypothetical protein
LALLRHYLDGLDKQDALLTVDPAGCGAGAQLITQLQEHFRLRNNKGRFDYNTVIVSLYGYLERYIEDLIGEYLEQVAGFVPKFLDLPPTVQANHLPLSIELARKADYQRYASSVRPEEVVAKLHACYASPDKYELNVVAFAQHSANFRQAVVTQTFAQCGIGDVGQGIKHSEPFTAFLKAEDPELDVSLYVSRDDDVVFSRLNDLANRRNDVAHGSPVDDTLSRDLLRGYVRFIEAYADALALVVYERTLPFLLTAAIPLGNAIKVINNSIVCINLPDGEIAVGDTLIAKTRDTGRPYKAGPIRELQRENTPLEKIVGAPGVQIGMRVEFGVKDNHEYYYFKTTRSVQPLIEAAHDPA